MSPVAPYKHGWPHTATPDARRGSTALSSLEINVVSHDEKRRVSAADPHRSARGAMACSRVERVALRPALLPRRRHPPGQQQGRLRLVGDDWGAQPSSGQQQPLPTGPTLVEKTRPTGALLREAMDALHVHGTRRAVSYELLTYWSPGGAVFPSVLTLSQGMGKKPRCVRAHLAALDRIGLWKREAREGETNIYDLRLPGVAPSAPKQPTSEPSTHLRAVDEKPVVSTSEGGTPVPGGAVPECRGGRHPSAGISNQRSNQEKSTSSGGARNVCENCKNDWPARFGTTCYQCGHKPSTASPADVQPTGNPDGYRGGRIRNCPKCHNIERGFEDSCQHCDWTRETAIERRATETPAPQPADPPKAEPKPKADKDALMRFWKDAREKYGKPSRAT